MYTHNLDPIIFDFGLIAIRWYSLAYIFGILIGWWYGKKIIAERFKIIGNKFELTSFDDLITFLVISILIGGRIGYILFYNFEYYISNPIDILKVWKGGMSFHGALIGICIGTFLFSKRKKIETFFLLDVIACVAPIGIFFGRIANFINAELVGKTTTVPWGVIFPTTDMMLRHPSQLYEAFLEGLLLFLIMNFVIHQKNYRTGICACLFLIFYGIFRIFAEIFREPDPQIGYMLSLFSMGTILSFLMLVASFIILIFLRRKNDF